MVGAGVVGVPYAFFNLGIPFAFLVSCLMALETICSCFLYFKVREFTGGLESLSEIGYKLLGRFSIYLINGFLTVNCVGTLVAYYYIFGGIITSLV